MIPTPRTLGIFPRPKAAHTGLWSWIITVDHKRIGIMYWWTALFLFLVGGTEALLVRVQLMYPNLRLFDPDVYNALFTMHATTVIFMGVMPLLAAFMNFFLPLQLGARDVAFPKLNAFSYWSFLFGAIFMNIGWFTNDVANMGWFAYAPLTLTKYTPHSGVDYWILGQLLLGTGTLVSGFNFITTVLNMRAPGMTLMRMPVFTWTTFIISVLVIFAFPAFTVALIMLLFDREFAGLFFDPMQGGNVVLWQHVFWTFGHPEVYIMILPAFGIISEVLPVFARKPLFGYSVVVFSSALIGFMAFTVWAHHMFAVGMGPVVNTIFALATAAISVPTGVKIFNWLATLWGGRLHFTTAMHYALAFLATFTVGGLSGFMHSLAPSDLQQTDTYFVVAHIHYVLVGGTLTAIFAGAYYWWPKMFGRMLDERIGKWNFWVFFIGFNLFAFPLHFLGVMGMPRRQWTYAADMGWNTYNLWATIGVFILTLGLLLFLYNAWVTNRKPMNAPADPWDARTLEWSIPSPPPEYNFREIPTVTNLDDWWYKKNPPPGSEKRGEPKYKPTTPEPHGIHLPGPSYMPFLVGLGNFILAAGIMYDILAVLVLGVLLTVVAVLGWILEGEGGTIIQPGGEH
ncbi:MAG: cytochrome c oxidase subunit I [Bacillota bacterium]